MTISSDTKKALLIIPILLVAGYFVYTKFVATPAVTSEAPPADFGGNGILGQDILIMVEKLRVISIDTSVFSGPLLTHLRDFSTMINPESKGKVDPFVPLVIVKPK